MRWKLKVLNGVHQDAEIELFGDTISIGSDALQADIVLSDAYIQAVHITLEVDGDVLLLTKAPSTEVIRFGSEIIRAALLQDDEPSEIERKEQPLGLEIPMGKKISIGKFVFAVVKIEDEWPDFTVTMTDETEIKKEPKTAIVWNKKILIVSIFLFLCIIAGAIGLLTDSASNPVDNETTSVQAIQSMNHYLESQNYTQVTVEWNATTQKVQLNGYVGTDQNREQILNKVKKITSHYEMRIFSNQAIVQSILFILKNYGYEHISVTMGKKVGTVILTGNIVNNKQWGIIEVHMEKDVPGLLGWHIEQPAIDVKTQMIQWLEELKLADRYQVKLYDDRIELTGSLQESDKEALNQLEALYQKTYPNGVKLELNSQQIETRPKSFNFTIKSVTLGTEPHIMLTDNRIYFPGSIISGGFVIYDITHDHITLLKGNTRILIKIRNIDNDSNQNDQP